VCKDLCKNLRKSAFTVFAKATAFLIDRVYLQEDERIGRSRVAKAVTSVCSANSAIGESVTDYAQRRLIDQNARGRTAPCLVDFTTINDSDRRDRRGADRLQFNTLRDKRTSDENRPLFNFLRAPGGLVDREIGEHRYGKHAGHDESYDARRCQGLHE
jgi:hypothetical protein